MLMWDVDEDCEQLVLWTPLGSHPSCSELEKPDSSHHWLLLSGLGPFLDSRDEGWEANSFRPSPLQSDCSQLFLLFKAKGSFANHLSQCKRGLELKTVEEYKERELAGQRHAKRGYLSVNESLALQLLAQDLSRMGERDRVLCGLALWYVTPGPVGHVSASLGSIWQWVEGVKNVCCLRTDVYFGYVQIHSFVEIPLKLVVSSSFALFWEIHSVSGFFSHPIMCAPGQKLPENISKHKYKWFEPEFCLIWGKRGWVLGCSYIV